VFEQAYKHECYISGRIHKLVKLAREEDDHPTEQFLQWFVGEQVEEEANTDEAVQTLKRAENSPGAMFMLDREFGGRAAPAVVGFAAGAVPPAGA
jgi:ferritin